MSDYITLEDVLAIHTHQIDTYGGSHGIRDPGLLEAALYRPQTGYYNSIEEEAAALWESLSQNHPFIDGNKRSAFACAITFLAINGKTLKVTDTEAQQFLLPLYAKHQVTMQNLLPWILKHCY